MKTNDTVRQFATVARFALGLAFVGGAVGCSGAPDTLSPVAAAAAAPHESRVNPLRRVALPGTSLYDMFSFSGSRAGTMVAPDSLISGTAAPAPSPLAPGATQWSSTRGGAKFDIAMAVVTDSSGNTIVTGGFTGSIDLGCGALTAAVGTYDLYVAKYSAAGACVWSKTFGGTGDTYGVGLAQGGDGSLYVVGTFNGTTNLGGGPIASAGGDDGFVLKLTSAGTYAWAKRIGGTGSDYPYAVAVNGSSVAVGGTFDGTASFGGATFTEAGASDAFVAQYSAADGSHAWSRALGSTGYDGVNAVAFTATGVAVAGVFGGAIDFGGGTLPCSGSYDTFLATYGATGAFGWANRFGGAGEDSAFTLAVGATGELYIAGYFQGSASFGGAAPITGAGKYTGYVARYDATGAYAWATADDASGLLLPTAMTIDTAGSVWIGGVFGGAISGQAVSSVGTNSAFVSKYSAANGDWQAWTKTYGGAGIVAVTSMALDGLGNVVSSGYFDTSVDLGSGSRLTNGDADWFVVAAAIL